MGKFPFPVDQNTIARDWSACGYDCRPFTDPPGQRWETFAHNFNELVTVIEGKFELKIEGKIMVMGPGDEVFIPAKAVHGVRNLHSGATSWLFGCD